MTRKFSRYLVAVAALALGAGGLVLATPSADDAVPQALGLAGSRAAIDAESGVLGRPNATQNKKLSSDLARKLARFAPSTTALTPVFHADGHISTVLPLSSMRFSMARVGPHGEIQSDCVTGVDAAGAYLDATSAPAREVK